MKRIITYLLVFTMIFSCLPVSVFATGGTTRGGGAGRRVADIVSGFDTYGSSYPDHLVSSGEADEVDPRTFMGLSVYAYDRYISTVSVTSVGEDGYSFYVYLPKYMSGIQDTYLAANAIVDDDGTYHFTDFYGADFIECISVYLDGTVATYVIFYDSFAGYDVAVIDYASYTAYTKITELLTDIAENMGVIEGGSADTSEIESSLSTITLFLDYVLTYLSDLNTSVANTETYVETMKSYFLSHFQYEMDNIVSDVDTIASEVSRIESSLASISVAIDDLSYTSQKINLALNDIKTLIAKCNASTNEILNTIASDVGEIKGDVSDIKDILVSIKDDNLKNTILSFLNSLPESGTSGLYSYLGNSDNDITYIDALDDGAAFYNISISSGQSVVPLISLDTYIGVFPDVSFQGARGDCFLIDPFNWKSNPREEFRQYVVCADRLYLDGSEILHFRQKSALNDFYYYVSVIFDGTTCVYLFWEERNSTIPEIVVVDYSSYLNLAEVERLLDEISSKLGSDADLESIDALMTQVVSLLTLVADSVPADVSSITTYVTGINTCLGQLRGLIQNGFLSTNNNLNAIKTKLTESMDLCNSILSTISGDTTQIKDDISESKGILATIRDKIDGLQSAVIGKLDELISAVRNIGGGSSGSDGSSFVADLLGGIFGVAFEALKLLLNLIFNLLSSVFGFIARFSAFVTSLWSGFIPGNILSILLVIPPLSFILGVIKFVRG